LLFFIANPPIRGWQLPAASRSLSFSPRRFPHPEQLYGPMPSSYIAAKYHCQQKNYDL
jgi:hypothetical protein